MDEKSIKKKISLFFDDQIFLLVRIITVLYFVKILAYIKIREEYTFKVNIWLKPHFNIWLKPQCVQKQHSMYIIQNIHS